MVADPSVHYFRDTRLTFRVQFPQTDKACSWTGFDDYMRREAVNGETRTPVRAMRRMSEVEKADVNTRKGTYGNHGAEC